MIDYIGLLKDIRLQHTADGLTAGQDTHHPDEVYDIFNQIVTSTDTLNKFVERKVLKRIASTSNLPPFRINMVCEACSRIYVPPFPDFPEGYMCKWPECKACLWEGFSVLIDS